MRKNSLLWSLAAATMMFFASCENENVPQTDGEDATVKIEVVSTPSTLSEGPENGVGDENKITYLEAFIFEGNVLLAHAPRVDVNGKAKSVTLNAKKNVPLTIAVVANNAVAVWDGTGSITLTQLKAKLSSHIFSIANSTGIPADGIGIPTNGFVMSYMEENYTVVEDVTSKPINIKRTVSKFDAPTFISTGVDLNSVDLAVVQTVFPTFKEENFGDEIIFDFEAFYLANGLNKSLLFNAAPYATSWWPVRSGWITNSPTETSLSYINSTFTNKQINTVYSGGFIDKDDITAGTKVYVHENYPYPDFTPVGSTVTGYNPLEVYCFIVKGTLKWNNITSADRFWRINLVKETTVSPKNDYYRIFRNGYYKVNVDLVKTVGHGTPEEAEKEVPVIPIEGDATVNITVTPAPWNVYVSETQM